MLSCDLDPSKRPKTNEALDSIRRIVNYNGVGVGNDPPWRMTPWSFYTRAECLPGHCILVYSDLSGVE